MDKERLSETENPEEEEDFGVEDIEYVSGAPEDYEETAAGKEEAEAEPQHAEAEPEGGPAEASELKEVNEKYLRLYAEFENYRKRINKEKDHLVRYANESLIYDLLTAMDHLDIALKHVGLNEESETEKAMRQGVEMTRREMLRTLEKYGLTPIEAEGQPFDPEIHHAMQQVERDDLPENTVVEEMRKGYRFRDRVLRASMVTVSKKTEGA